MKLPPRIVAVDYGRKRAGLALADPLRLIAQPFGTYSPDDLLKVLIQLKKDEGIETVVVGWPLTQEGEEGPATEKVQMFINRMVKVLAGVSFVKWDERFSSQIAREAIRSAGVKKKKRRDKARVDAAAAAVILQEYLDSAGESEGTFSGLMS